MSITYRPATMDDLDAIFDIFIEAVLDLGARLNVPGLTGGQTPEVMADIRERRRPLFEHLGKTATHQWVAERDSQIIGYARSFLRDGVLQLTEFFVQPRQQSAGVGRELLSRAFPREGAKRRYIIATIDTRAQARYLKAGVYPQFPIAHFSDASQVPVVSSDLEFQPMIASPETIATLGQIDAAILHYRRDIDHEWLIGNRAGYFYLRAGQPVGYGYVGRSSGPFAVLDANDFPAVLAHAHGEVAALGYQLGVEVPLINRVAVDYLLAHGFQLDGFIECFMSDTPFGKFENYIFLSPPLFS